MVCDLPGATATATLESDPMGPPGGQPGMTAQQEVPPIGPIARYEQNIVDRINDFNDPRQEWRRLFSELLGTFFWSWRLPAGG